MQGIRNSLRCISHPSSIFAILLLILNDHLLKHQFPGVFSGKISDFAGLYFFPFLISLALGISRIRSPQLGILSFLLTGLIFFSIKVIPWANSFLVDGMRNIFGLAFQITLDPTDLIALLSMWPAWRLWSRYNETHSRRLSRVVIIIASIATLATSIAPEESITRLALEQDVIYAYSAEYDSVSASYDNGLTWQYYISAPEEVMAELKKPVNFPKVVCDIEQPLACFRISTSKVIEYSDDGGKTWRIVWEIPPDRWGFMSRQRRSTTFGPNDILLVNHRENSFVIAAMGNQGILIGYQDGTWIRESIGSAYPTPLYLTNASQIVWLLDPEIFILASASILAYLLLCWRYWRAALGLPKRSQGEDLLRRVLKPVRFGFILGILSLIFILPQILCNLYPIFWPILLLFPLAPFLGSIVSWKRIMYLAPRNSRIRIARLVSSITGFSPLIFGSIPLILWTMGFIGKYSVALITTIFLSSSILLIGYFATQKLAKNIELSHCNV